MDLIFAYIAGLLTLINPCVLPVLPIVLASAAQADRRGPVLLAAGMSLSFVVIGMAVIVAGNALGVNEGTVIRLGAWAMLAFGLILLIPQLSSRFAHATTGVSGRADMAMDALSPVRGRDQFLGGALLGLIWSPCIGPTLGGAIALASQRQSLPWSFAIMVFFALGVSSIILGLAFGTREAIRSRKAVMARLAAFSRPVLGGAFVLVAVLVLTGAHHAIEEFLLNVMPSWLLDLSVRF